jgi:general stress protein YciG
LQEELTVREAGRRGGLAVLRNYGREFFVEVGKKGQKAMRQKYGKDMASKWGKKGGRPRKPNLREIMGQEGKI